MEHVNIQDENVAEMLRAIGLSCPHLNDVAFAEKKKGDDSPPSHLELDSDVNQQLELALTKWPKVTYKPAAKKVDYYITLILLIS